MSSSARERLAFNHGPGTVPGRGTAEALIASEVEPTFATAEFAEPRDWGYLGLLAFTAVLLLRPQDQLPGLSALHLAEICAIIGIGPMLLHRFVRRLPVFRVTPETLGLIAFGAVIVGTIPFSIWPGGAFGVFTDAYLKLLVVFVLMMNTLTTPKRLQQVMWLILLCVGYIAARGVFDYARGVNLVEGGRLAGAVGGIFGNPNDLAMNMVTLLPSAAVVAISPRSSGLRRGTAALIVALMMATIVFTKSRGAMLGLVVMLVILVIVGRKIRRGFATMVAVGVVAATPFMPSSFWARMASIVDERRDAREFTGSREARRIVMQEGIATFVERPLTGVGAGQFQNHDPTGRQQPWKQTHNALIQTAAETGIFGLLAFTFLIVRGAMASVVTRRMLTRIRQRRGAADAIGAVLSEEDQRWLYAHSVAMTAGLAGWFTCAMFASVAYNWTFYYMLALTVAAREMTRDRLTAAQALDDRRRAAMTVSRSHVLGRLIPRTS
jgi:O-antigen ligase